MTFFRFKKKGFVHVMNSKAYLKNCQSEIKKNFVSRKKQSVVLADCYKALSDDDISLKARYRRVSDCGSFLEFYVSEDSHKLHLANFCKDRLCPMCNWRRSKKIFAQSSKVMDIASERGYQFLFLTLTIRNCSFDLLEETINVLFDGWRQLYHKKAFFKKFVLGSFRALEITVNKKERTFHPHLHCILAVNDSYFKNGYLTAQKWASLWGSCCGLDYDPSIRIEALKGDFLRDKGVISYWRSIKEVSKYIAKGSDYLDGSFSDVLEKVSVLLSSLSGRRLCSFTGVLKDIARQLRLDDLENGDLINFDDDSLRNDLTGVMVRYRWFVGLRGYVSDFGEVVD